MKTENKLQEKIIIKDCIFLNVLKWTPGLGRQHSVTKARENCKLQWAKWKVNHVLTLRSCFWIKLMFVTWSNKSSFSHCRLFQCSFRESHGKKLAVETRHSNSQGKKNNSQCLCVFKEVSHQCASSSSFGWLFIVSPCCSSGAILRKPAIFWVYSSSSHRHVPHPT